MEQLPDSVEIPCVFVLGSVIWWPGAPGSYKLKCGDYYLLASPGRRESSAPLDSLAKFYYSLLLCAPIEIAPNFRVCH